MPDLHAEFERAATLAAAATPAPCWFCGAPCPAHAAVHPPQCADSAACFARSVSPGSEAHPADCGACPESAPCGACARAYAEPDPDDGADVGEP